MSDIKNFLLNFNLFKKDGDFNSYKIKHLSPFIIDNITQLTPNCQGDIKERIYWILNDLTNYPKKCLTCDKSIKVFINFKVGYKYDYCSNKNL